MTESFYKTKENENKVTVLLTLPPPSSSPLPSRAPQFPILQFPILHLLPIIFRVNLRGVNDGILSLTCRFLFFFLNLTKKTRLKGKKKFLIRKLKVNNNCRSADMEDVRLTVEQIFFLSSKFVASILFIFLFCLTVVFFFSSA